MRGSRFQPLLGTSAAAPHAGAIAALINSFNPALTPAQINTILTSTAIDIEAMGWDRDTGIGIVMANQALASLCSITCPANITQNCAAAACLVVNFPPPTASDNCPGVTTACNPPSGSCLPTGVTTVTCTATDASGNTATCSFTVTVFDVALQDDSDPSTILLWNSSTGAYRFCCKGVTYIGVGKASIQGCVYTLQHNPADRRVLGRVDKAVHRGTASIQAPAATNRCNITDRNTLNNTNLTSCQ